MKIVLNNINIMIIQFLFNTCIYYNILIITIVYMDTIPLELVYVIKSYLDINDFYNSQLICWNFYSKPSMKEKIKLFENNNKFMKIIKKHSVGPLLRITKVVYQLDKIICGLAVDSKDNKYFINYKVGSLKVKYLGGDIIQYKNLSNKTKNITRLHLDNNRNIKHNLFLIGSSVWNNKNTIYFKKYEIDYYKYDDFNYCLDIIGKTIYRVYKITNSQYHDFMNRTNYCNLYDLQNSNKKYCNISDNQLILY